MFQKQKSKEEKEQSTKPTINVSRLSQSALYFLAIKYFKQKPSWLRQTINGIKHRINFTRKKFHVSYT